MKTVFVPTKQHVYLEAKRSRWQEFFFAWRVFIELFRGIRALHNSDPCITVFGSARFKADHKYCLAAEAFGKRIAKLGITTMTGGGPGIMEAANKGAFESDGLSIGCNIKLPFEQHVNAYVHKSFTFEHFFIRKVLLVKYSCAFIIMPGGFGTMDEFFETLTLIQTQTMNKFPIVLYDKTYYQPLSVLLESMVAQGTVSEKDMQLVIFTDDIDEGFNHIQKYLSKTYLPKRGRTVWTLEEASK